MSMLETLPLMMLGMALFRNGFLTGGWAAADYRRTARRWLPPGVLLTLLGGWLQWRSGFDYLVAVNEFMAWEGPGHMMITIAYAALLILLFRRFAARAVIVTVPPPGREGFSTSPTPPTN